MYGRRDASAKASGVVGESSGAEPFEAEEWRDGLRLLLLPSAKLLLLLLRLESRSNRLEIDRVEDWPAFDLPRPRLERSTRILQSKLGLAPLLSSSCTTFGNW